MPALCGRNPTCARLSHRQRILRAAERAEDADLRRPKESRAAWQKRNHRARATRHRLGEVEDRAAAMLGRQIARLTADDSDPPKIPLEPSR